MSRHKQKYDDLVAKYLKVVEENTASRIMKDAAISDGLIRERLLEDKIQQLQDECLAQKILIDGELRPKIEKLKRQVENHSTSNAGPSELEPVSYPNHVSPGYVQALERQIRDLQRKQQS